MMQWHFPMSVPFVQRKAVVAGKRADAMRPVGAPRSAIQGRRPLSVQQRNYIETRFGRDFSGVRLHPQAGKN